MRKKSDISDLQKVIVETCNAIGRRVDAVINQDGCRIADDLYDRYADMVAYVKKHHYDRSARYATSAITRQKLQDALKRRGLDTVIFERAEDAHDFLNLKRQAAE